MNPSISAFVTSVPCDRLTSFTGTSVRSSPSSPRRPSLIMTAQPQPSPSPWDGLRRVVRLSAISASVLIATALPVPRQNHLRSRFFSAPSIAAQTTTSQTTTSPNSSSDVEAAAMTLGAVTVGGLVMRAIINSKKDEDEERRRLKAECDRLQQQEQERSLRAQRKQMENLEDHGAAPISDDQLMSDFMSRVKSLDADDSDLDDNQSNDASMRHSPIPDRGTGSAVLDPPDHTNPIHGDELDSPDDSTDPSQEMAKPEEAEMLKRMWNLSSPDKE